jgi:hypothetical protein
VRRRADATAMRVRGLHALLRSDGSDEPVDVSPVELTLAPIEKPPLVMWVSDRAFERGERLRVHSDDTVTVIERDPPVRRPVWPDDEEW